MSPSISSIGSPVARAKLTANCAATLVFPSWLAALVTASTLMPASSSDRVRLVRRLSMLSSKSLSLD